MRQQSCLSSTGLGETHAKYLIQALKQHDHAWGYYCLYKGRKPQEEGNQYHRVHAVVDPGCNGHNIREAKRSW